MKVFVSWSGETSHKVATIIRDWLPNVIQSIVPYVSSEDIDKGARWSKDISEELAESFYGILCVTKQNLTAPWLNFEAGALSKAIENSNVVPFLFDLRRADVNGPILQFQSTIFEKEDVRKLLHGINRADKNSNLSEVRLDSVFEVWWPQLQSALQEVLAATSTPKLAEKASEPNKDSQMLEEVLELARQQSRALASQEKLMAEFYREAVETRSRSSRESFDHPAIREILASVVNIRTIVEAMSECEDKVKLELALHECRHAVDYMRSKSYRNRSMHLTKIDKDSF